MARKKTAYITKMKFIYRLLLFLLLFLASFLVGLIIGFIFAEYIQIGKIEYIGRSWRKEQFSPARICVLDSQVYRDSCQAETEKIYRCYLLGESCAEIPAKPIFNVCAMNTLLKERTIKPAVLTEFFLKYSPEQAPGEVGRLTLRVEFIPSESWGEFVARLPSRFSYTVSSKLVIEEGRKKLLPGESIILTPPIQGGIEQLKQGERFTPFDLYPVSGFLELLREQNSELFKVHQIFLKGMEFPVGVKTPSFVDTREADVMGTDFYPTAGCE